MQQADCAHSATITRVPPTNVLPFPNRHARLGNRLGSRARRSWPSATSHRTPEMLIALAACAAMTPAQRQHVRALVSLDLDIFGDAPARTALAAVEALA